MALSVSKRVTSLTRGRTDDVDATLLANAIYEAIDGDDQLRALLATTERAYGLADDREQAVGYDDPIRSAAFDAAETLNDLVVLRVDEIVAEACATVVAEAEGWDDAWSSAKIHVAVEEAEAWLAAHPRAAERVDVAVPEVA